MKSAVRVSVLALAAFAVLEETALARSYLSCLAKKVVIVDAPKGTTSSSAEENFGFWLDEPTKIVTFADGKKVNVRRFDDHWISAVSGDVSYELDRQNGNQARAGRSVRNIHRARDVCMMEPSRPFGEGSRDPARPPFTNATIGRGSRL
jgi:hypothetical protein